MQYINALKEYLMAHYFNSSFRNLKHILIVYLTAKFDATFYQNSSIKFCNFIHI